MPFVISPDEARAIQEDEAQLIAAITQVAQRLSAAFTNGQTPPAISNETLRIQMGRRLVYGQLAHGPFRHELNENSLKVILDAIQQPVTEGADLEHYRGKVPAIEIRDGETVLFREERDGAVTVNQIHVQLATEHNPSQAMEPLASERVPDSPIPILNGNGSAQATQPQPVQPTQPIPDQPQPTKQAIEVAQIATNLLNPLQAPEPIFDAVSIAGYSIKRSDRYLAISKDGDLILVARKGQIVNDRVNRADWETFQQLGEQTQRLSDGLSSATSTQTQGQSDELNDGLERDIGTTQPVPPALQVLERETAKLPESPTKQVLTAAATDWKQQVAQGLRRGARWLAAQPEALRQQRIAYTVLDLFHRGYERTGEHTYRIGKYVLGFRGRNLYSLRDAKGKLIEFQTSRVLGLGQRLKILSVSPRLHDLNVRDLFTLHQDKLTMPQGNLDVEAIYAAKTQQVEQTIRTFLQKHVKANTWNKEGGQYKLEIGTDNFLCITDKQNGRGVVFRRQNNEVFSKLGPRDFAHFKRLTARLQQTQSKAQIQTQTQTQTPQKSIALEID